MHDLMKFNQKCSKSLFYTGVQMQEWNNELLTYRICRNLSIIFFFQIDKPNSEPHSKVQAQIPKSQIQTTPLYPITFGGSEWEYMVQSPTECQDGVQSPLTKFQILRACPCLMQVWVLTI